MGNRASDETLAAKVGVVTERLATLVATQRPEGPAGQGREIRGVLPRSLCTARAWSSVREGRETSVQLAHGSLSDGRAVFAPAGWRCRYRRAVVLRCGSTKISIDPVERSLLRIHVRCGACGKDSAESVLDHLGTVGLDGKNLDFWVKACPRCRDAHYLDVERRATMAYLDDLKSVAPDLHARIYEAYGDE